MGNFWAVTMVKDELDVLPYTLAHLASEGAAGIIVADNMSTDGTTQWLMSQRGRIGDTELIVKGDHEVGYYQSRKMTDLARWASDEFGAEWVLPFDADELWFNASLPLTLSQTFALAPDAACLQARLHNHFPTSDDPDEPNPFLRIQHRDPKPGPLPKIIMRGTRDVFWIEQGNHGFSTPEGARCADTTIEVAHFPWRCPEQFERKVRNGYAAYLATDLPEDMGAHWRQYGELLEQRGPDALREVYDTWFHDPEVPLELAPAPWCRTLADPRVH